jgi:hypothetical protein
MFTKDCPWTITWASWNQSTLSHPISLTSIRVWQSPPPQCMHRSPMQFSILTKFCLYFSDPSCKLHEWMKEWIHKGWAFPALVLWLSMIYCASPFLFSPLSILHFEWNAGLCLWGRHNSHLVPLKTGPSGKILNKL